MDLRSITSCPSRRGTGRLLAYGEEFPNAFERIAPGALDLWAQVYHAIREEWAVTTEDVIYRRTTLGLRGFDTPEIRRRISTVIEPEARILPSGLRVQPLRTTG